MKFIELYQSWYRNKKHYVKKSTISAYMLLVENHLLPIFSNHDEILEVEVQEFILAKIEAGLSHKTTKDIVIVLNMILKHGAKYHKFPYKPFDLIYPTNHGREKIEVLTKDQQKKLSEHIVENMDFRKIGILICLQAGLRIGEICALQWKDLDVDNKVIDINKTIQRIYSIENGVRKTDLIIDNPKTKTSNREIPMSRDVHKVVKYAMKFVNPDFFVLTNASKPTEPRTYRNFYKKLMESLELPALKFHGLRHSFATRCVEKNVDIKTVSVILGHSNISTTLNLYVHPNEEQKRSAINKVFR